MRVSNFERKIGASNGTIGKCIKNDSDLSSKWITAIVKTFDDIDPISLITGEGEILKNKPELLGEPAIAYLSEQNKKVDAIQDVMDALQEKMEQSSDPNMKPLVKEIIQLFNKLVSEFDTQKASLAETIEYHQKLKSFIKEHYDLS